MHTLLLSLFLLFLMLLLLLLLLLLWHLKTLEWWHSTGEVAFGRFVQGCSSRSEAHVAGQDPTTLLGLKCMHIY